MSLPRGFLELVELRCLSLDNDTLSCLWADVQHLVSRYRHFIDVITCNRSASEDQIIDRWEGDRRRALERCLPSGSASGVVGSKSLVSFDFQKLSVSLALSALCAAVFLSTALMCFISGRRRRRMKLRITRDRIAGQNLLKTGSTTQMTTSSSAGALCADRAKILRRQLFVFCSETNSRWVCDEVVNVISREFAGHGLSIIVRIVQPSSKSDTSRSSADSDQWTSTFVLRTALVFLSRDWIRAVAEAQDGSVNFASELFSTLPVALTSDWNICFVLSEEINSADVNHGLLLRSIQQYPCLNAGDRYFQKALLRRLKRSFLLGTRFRNRRTDVELSLKLTNENSYESISEDAKERY